MPDSMGPSLTPRKGRTHRLEGEASRRGESVLSCRSKARERLRCRRSRSSSFWGRSSRTGVPGVLRGAFRGRGMENTRFDGEEALCRCPRVSEEELPIVMKQSTCSRTVKRTFPRSKGDLGHHVEKFTIHFPPRSQPTLMVYGKNLYSLGFLETIGFLVVPCPSRTNVHCH